MSVRKVTAEDAAPCPIADQIRAIAEKAIAMGAVVFLGIWETPAAFHSQAAPHAESVTRGLLIRMAEEYEEGP